MKIKKVINMQNEFNHLQSIANNINTALDDFNKQETRNEKIVFYNGTVTCGSFTINIDEGKVVEAINVRLDGELVKRIKPKLVKILKKELQKIKEEQNLLEI